VHPLREPVRTYAFGLPDAWEDHPWGESVAKVGKKVFAFFGVTDADDLYLGVKLPHSVDEALSLPFVEPMGYNLSRGNWVSARVPADAPLEMLLAWIEESYRAVASKRLLAQLDGTATGA
jgi:predicted DNA-binding protein (MmcQ/YjbR family)